MYQVVFVPNTASLKMRCYDFDTMTEARNFVNRCIQRAAELRMFTQTETHDTVQECTYIYSLDNLESLFAFIEIYKLDD